MVPILAKAAAVYGVSGAEIDHASIVGQQLRLGDLSDKLALRISGMGMPGLPRIDLLFQFEVPDQLLIEVLLGVQHPLSTP
nr:hypothetical protein [uncultured Duganella sp.]